MRKIAVRHSCSHCVFALRSYCHAAIGYRPTLSAPHCGRRSLAPQNCPRVLSGWHPSATPTLKPRALSRGLSSYRGNLPPPKIHQQHISAPFAADLPSQRGGPRSSTSTPARSPREGARAPSGAPSLRRRGGPGPAGPGPRGSPSARRCGWAGAACAAPSPQSGGCARA